MMNCFTALTERLKCGDCMRKYMSKKVTVDGITFDSKKEAARYCELKLMKRAGKIKDLELQKTFELIPAQREPDTIGARGGVKKGKIIERAVTYTADFSYIDTKTGETVVEDVKGYRDPASAGIAKYILKRKLMLYIHGIKIREI